MLSILTKSVSTGLGAATLRRAGGRFVVALMSTILFIAAGPARAAALSWSSLLGGSAGSSGNWTPSQIPNATDDLTFNLSFNYPVTYPATVATTRSHTYKRGNVTMTAIVPHTVTDGFNVGSVNGDDGDLTLAAGNLTVNTNLNVGDAGGSSGILSIDGSDAIIDIVGAASDLNIGRSGTGELEIIAGGEINVGDDFIIGATSSGIGTATISGGVGAFPNLFRSNVQTTSVTSGDIIVGNAGDGALILSNGGVVNSAHDVKLAVSSTAMASVDVSGFYSFFPSSIIAGRNLDIARNDNALAAGSAVLTLNSGTTAIANGMTRIGDAEGGSGALELNGGQISSVGGIDVQPSGTIVGTGIVNADVTNLGSIAPTGANGLRFDGFLSNTTNNVVGTRIFFGATGGYIGSGACVTEIDGEDSSSITATGNLVLGTGSVIGINYSGTLNVGNHIVTLLDSNGCVLGGVSNIDGGTLQCATNIGIEVSGTIRGDGQINADVIAAGQLDPHTDGLAGGTLSINGNLNMNSSGSLVVEIGGAPGSGNSGRVDISGTANLNGTVRVRLKNGYVPQVGQQFIIANAMQGRAGEFTSIEQPPEQNAPCNDVTFALAYSSSGAIILVRPPVGCLALGDLNSDGRHDGLDLQLFVNALLDSSYDNCADMNGDCSVDVEDIVPFIQKRM